MKKPELDIVKSEKVCYNKHSLKQYDHNDKRIDHACMGGRGKIMI